MPISAYLLVNFVHMDKVYNAMRTDLNQFEPNLIGILKKKYDIFAIDFTGSFGCL